MDEDELFEELLRARESELHLQGEVNSLRAQLAAQRELIASLQASMLADQPQDGHHARFVDEEGSSNSSSSNNNKDPPLIVACRAGDAGMASVLLDATGCWAPGAAERAWALQVACQHGRHDVAALLVARGADLHADHDSALLWACRSGDEAMARLLLDAGADAGALGGCALRLAVRGGFCGVAELIVGRREKAAGRRPAIGRQIE